MQRFIEAESALDLLDYLRIKAAGSTVVRSGIAQ